MEHTEVDCPQKPNSSYFLCLIGRMSHTFDLAPEHNHKIAHVKIAKESYSDWPPRILRELDRVLDLLDNLKCLLNCDQVSLFLFRVLSHLSLRVNRRQKHNHFTNVAHMTWLIAVKVLTMLSPDLVHCVRTLLTEVFSVVV